MNSQGSTGLNLDNLLERIMTIRPDAGLEDIRRFAPVFCEISDEDLKNRMARMTQRITTRSGRKKKR